MIELLAYALLQSAVAVPAPSMVEVQAKTGDKYVYQLVMVVTSKSKEDKAAYPLTFDSAVKCNEAGSGARRKYVEALKSKDAAPLVSFTCNRVEATALGSKPVRPTPLIKRKTITET